MADNPYAQFFGIEVDRADDGAVDVRVEARDELGHRAGWFHGTVVNAIGEICASWSAITKTPPGWQTVVVQQSMFFTASARGERLLGRGRVIKAGRTISTAAAEIFVVSAGIERSCGTLVQSLHHSPPGNHSTGGHS